MNEKTLYFGQLEEARAHDCPIPSIGAATTAIDQYRSAGIQSTNLPDLGAAFTDPHAMAALARVAEGGLTSYRDIVAAETALQALLLHEIVHVVVQAPKVDYGAVVTYARWDQSLRSPLAFDIAALANSRDFIIAPDFLKVEDGIVKSGRFKDSPLIGMPADQLHHGFDYWSPHVADALNAAITQHGISAYLTDPKLARTRRGEGFEKGFYSRLNISWRKATEGIPPVEVSFEVPPLLAIVLNRLNNRADLKAELQALREELAPVRGELRAFNNIVTQPISQQEVARRVKYLHEAFDAIMLEASLSTAERFQRRFAFVQGIARPIVKLMAGFVMKTGPSLDDLVGLSPLPRMVIEDASMVDRTVTSQTFSKLIKVEAVQALAKHHFSPAELVAIETSLSRDDL